MFRALRRLILLASLALLAFLALAVWSASNDVKTQRASTTITPVAPASRSSAGSKDEPQPTEAPTQSTFQTPSVSISETTKEPNLVEPVEAVFDGLIYEKLPQDPEIDHAIVLAVGYCRKNKKQPEIALRAIPELIERGAVIYLADAAEVIAAIDDGIQILLSDGTSAFLKGVNKNNVVSGSRVIPGLVLVKGSTEYKNAFFANRLGWNLEAITETKWKRAESLFLRQEATAKRNNARNEHAELTEQIENLPTASLTSSDGQFKTTATIIDFADGAYVMRREDGKEITVPDAKLDEASQFTARSQMKRVVSAKRRLREIEKELGISNPSQIATAE